MNFKVIQLDKFIRPLSHFFTGIAFREHKKAFKELIMVFEIVLQLININKTFRGVNGEFRGFSYICYIII